jgi:hypothetical protein
MRRAQLIGLVWGMKRIAEANQAGDPSLCVQLVGNEACHPPAHGFAADQQWRPLGHPGDGRAILVHEPLGLRGRLPGAALAPSGHIAELEAQGGNVPFGQKTGDGGHEGGVYSGTCPMRVQQTSGCVGWATGQVRQGHCFACGKIPRRFS